MQYITENWEQLLTVAAGVIATASAVAVLTPNTIDNKVVSLVRKLVDLLALNFGNAKNEKPKE